MSAAIPPKGGIRVALVGLPSMLHDIIAGLVEGQADMKMVAAESAADLLTLVRETGASVVIVGMEKDELPLAYRHELDVLAQLKVMGVTERGNRAVLYRLLPEAVELRDVSPQGLLTATRTPAGTMFTQR